MSTVELNFCQHGTDHSFQITIDPSLTVLKLWEQLECEVLIPFSSFSLKDADDKPIKLIPTKTLISYGETFQDGALFIYDDLRFDVVSTEELQFLNSKQQNPEALGKMLTSRPPFFMKMIEKFPQLLTQLSYPFSELYNTKTDVHSREFFNLLARYVLDYEHRRKYWEKYCSLHPDDPIGKEEMRFVEGHRQMQQQWEYAMEYTPENFGSVSMLYVPFEINDTKLAAFVDSGAEMTLISLSFAKRVGLDHLIDTRFSGRAQGVGSGTILGSIHSVKVKLGNEFLSLKFQVLDGINLDVLLGLDNLKRHQMNINLASNCLEFNNQKIPFLSEGQIKDFERERIRAKVSHNKASGQKDDANMDDGDKHLLNQLNDTNSGKKVGTSGSTIQDMLQFMTNNIGDIKKALNYVTDSYEFDILQKQRVSNVTTRPDQQLRDHFSSNTIPQSILHPQGGGQGSGLGGLPDLSPEQEAQAIAQLQQMVQSGQLPNLPSDPNDPAAMQALMQLMQLLGQANGANGGAGGANTMNNGQQANVPQQLQQQQQQSQGPRIQVDRTKLNQLVAMGFPIDEATNALALYANDLDMALLHLQGDMDD